MDLRKVGQLNLLTALIWGEARGEPYDGKFAVGMVVFNRVNDPRWPDTYEEVILQPKQFSCFNIEDPNHHEILKAVIPSRNGNWQNMTWRECRSSAQLVLGRWREDNTKGANHYHSIDCDPRWDDNMILTITIGDHEFFKA